MKVFVSFDGDHIGRMVGRASLADKPEEVSKIAQAIDRGSQIWRSWAESHGGQVINIGGDEGRLVVEADHLSELPKIRDQYAEAVGSTVSVGVGMKLSEADKSLMAAKLQGGNRIQLFTEEVNEVLEELKEKPEGEKLYDEYLDPEAGLQKAQPGMNQGTNAGFSGASHSQPAAPAAPREGSEHSEAEAARQVYADAPGAAPTPDYEQLFHQVASQTPEDAPQKPSGLQDDVRAQVVKILQQVRGQAPKLEEMRQANPDLYASVKGLVEAMIALARGQDEQAQPEPVEKAEDRVGYCKWKLGERRCRRLCTGDYCHTHAKHVKALRKDLMPGGQGDDLPDADFSADQLEDGTRREMEEHGLDEERAAEVAKDHLTEDPDYYLKMAKGDPWFDEQRAKQDQWVKRAEELASTTRGSAWNTRFGDVVVVGMDPSKPGGWRATTLRTDGSPKYHWEAKDHIGALKLARTGGVDIHGTPIQTMKKDEDTIKFEKAALEAGKTGRHQVVLPVGAQVDPGPSANHEGGEIKVRDPETGKSKWRQVRSGLVMAPDGTPTSSRNPGG